VEKKVVVENQSFGNQQNFKKKYALIRLNPNLCMKIPVSTGSSCFFEKRTG